MKNLLIYLTVCLVAWRGVDGSYDPVYGSNPTVFYNLTGDGRHYPDNYHVVKDEYLHFISSLNFDAVPGSVVVGARNTLLLLSNDLQGVAEAEWGITSGSCTVDCNNHIRVFRKIPGTDWLLVCGTQQSTDIGRTSQCRAVTYTESSLTLHNTVDATPGLASYLPELPGFGEFRNSSESDRVYFAAGYSDGPNTEVDAHFSASFQTVSFADPNDPNTLTTTVEFGTVEDDNYWLRFPVQFVDYHRADYASRAMPNRPADYQFYFLFLTENFYDPSNPVDLIISQVVRICRNDRGSLSTPDGNIFNTYIKARVFCQRVVPTTIEFAGALDNAYNELTSVAINADNGRYTTAGTDTSWLKRMYGAFSGPAIGPKGTALCVYPAYDSFTLPGGDGNNRGVFDIYREPILQSNENHLLNGETDNNLVECLPTGRFDNMTNQLSIVRNIIQTGSDPLFVLDGVLITQIVLDQQCIVMHNNEALCQNQDILFLGTDNGRVMKLVFGIDASSMTFPVVSEEMLLDDSTPVGHLEIYDGFLYINTLSHLYRVPLERCSRHATCEECAASRDPYCVWNINDGGNCERSQLSAPEGGMGAVPNNIRQSIHSGTVAMCSPALICSLTTSSSNYYSVSLSVSCSNTNLPSVSVSIPTMSVAVTLLLSNGQGSAVYEDPARRGLTTHAITVTAELKLFTTYQTTMKGPPVDINSDSVLISTVDCRSIQVTVSFSSGFTDEFSTYYITVDYGTAAISQRITQSRTVNVSGFTPSTTVPLTITVFNSVGTTPPYVSNFNLCEGTPEQVMNLIGQDIEATRVVLQWNQPAVTNGLIYGYAISQGNTGIINCVGRSGSVFTGNTFEVTGLTPATSYTFTVVACTSAGEGLPASVTVMTLCSAPQSVENFILSANSSSLLTYSWSRPTVPNGNIDNYDITEECYQTERSVITTKTVTAAGAQTITNLPPRTLCCVTIRGVNQCGGPLFLGTTQQMCTETLDVVPGMVENVTVFPVSYSSIVATWDSPSNYRRPGLNYSIEVLDSTTSMTVGVGQTVNQQSFFVSGLVGQTEYTVRVMAISSEGQSLVTVMEGTTLSPPPPAPTDVGLTFIGASNNLMLRVSWTDATSGDFFVMSYEVCIRCNDLAVCMDTPNVVFQQDFNVADPGAFFSWCTAQVRGQNSIGKGNFSDLEQIVYPPTAPSQPRCFLQDDFGGSVNITFTVTYPFTAVDLTVNYNWTSEVGTMDSASIPFGASSSNNILLPTSRLTMYDFQLWLCNSNGCSEPCQDLRNFSTSSVSPRPPSTVLVSSITVNSVNVSWDHPVTENETIVDYVVQLTGGGISINDRLDKQRWRFFDGLKGETTYTVAVRLIDTVSGITGLFGPAVEFTTEVGIPSKPLLVVASYVSADQRLLVTWSDPTSPNGIIRKYEVQWSDTGIADCDDPDGTITQSFFTVDPTMRPFSTTNTSNIASSDAALVCVRAYTNQPGNWEFHVLIDFTELPVTVPCGSEYTGLIVVAVIAGCSVPTTAVLGIILLVVIHRRWNLRQCCQRREEKSPEGGEHAQHNGGSQRPEYNTQSSLSRNPLISGDKA